MLGRDVGVVEESAEGVGDGAGVNVDLSVSFFSEITGKTLQSGAFGVGNFFLPTDPAAHAEAGELVSSAAAVITAARHNPASNTASATVRQASAIRISTVGYRGDSRAQK